MLKQTSNWLALLALGMAFQGTAQADEVDIGVMSCVSPELASYWTGTASKPRNEVIVVYSAEGFFQDLKERLPPNLFGSLVEASEKALATNEVNPNLISVEPQPAVA
ncbi:MAG: hypothetical protein ACREXR_17815 [Gammaproteobacteria bacterium]